MELESVFLGLFVVGFAGLLLSFVLGAAHGHGHLPHLHIPHLPHLHLPGPPHVDIGGPHGGSPSADLSVVNPSTVLTFLTWFGGVGYILSALGGFGPWAVLGLATLGGLVGAGVVAVVLVRYLLPGQTPYMLPEEYRIEGTLARVTVPIGEGRTGEVVYERHGALRSEGARSADGTPLPRGCEVVVMQYERGLAYVRSLDALLEERGRGPEALLPPSDERATG